MPIYEYVCEQCGKLNEVLQRVGDPPPGKCDGCGTEQPLKKVVSRTSFVLKGGGWYSDLYSSAKKDTKKEGGGSKPSESSTKPAATTTTSTPSTGSGDKKS